MSTLPFGQARPLAHNRRHAALMLGVSAAALVLLTPARAETITYSNGEDRTAEIVLAEDGVLSLEPSVSAIQSGNISGDYAITISGGGRLRLSGDNSHTGGTIVDGASLGAASDTALGTGAVTLRNGSNLYLAYERATAFSNDMVLTGANNVQALNETTLTGTISGATGRLTAYSGHLILTGTNTYGGGTDIGSSGTTARISALSDGALGSGQVAFRGNSTFTLGDGVTISNAVNLAAFGSQEKTIINASGSATLAGDMTVAAGQGKIIYNGGTIIRTGRDDFAGSVRVTGNATLVASGVDVLSDEASIVLDSNGTLRIATNQTVGGLAQFGGDTSGTIDLANRRLITVQDSSTTFGGTITGTSTSVLELNGAGRLTLAGDNAAWGGSLVVRDGILEVNGDFSNAFAIVNGARLQGTGHLGTVNLNQGATMVGVQGQILTMDRLVISSGSVLSVALGAPGGAELFHIVGDIELDGYIDITDAGGFGPGVYRIATYGGSLFNQDANIRDLPDGIEPEDVQLQLLEGQVNIVSSAGVDIAFWDGGNAGNWNNGRIDGGDGVWDDRAVFTSADGSTNGQPHPDPGFVIFGGRAGTVEIDADYVNVDGMQFITDGYTLTGGNIRIDEGERIVRIGDGSASGAGTTTTIASAFTGDGRLAKTDAGRLVLTGLSTHTGGTEVRGGVLEVDGAIEDVLVGVDGLLTGNGSVRNAQVDGRIGATGFDEFSITGDLSLSENAIFQLAIDAEGNSGLVVVAGTAFLDGTVDVLASGGNYADATRYTFLRAENGLEGLFNGVVDNLAFLDSTLEYEANDVSLLLTRNGIGFGSVGETPNQRATGQAVETLGAGNAIYDRVLTYDVGDANHAFDQLSGEIYATAQGTLLAAAGKVPETMSDRLDTALDHRDASGELVFWSEAGAATGVLRGDGNAAETAFSAGNVFVGADAVFNGNWVFGAMGGYSVTHGTVPTRSSTADIDSLYAGIYGGGELGNTTLKFGSAVGVNHTKTTRSVTLPGSAETLTANRSGASVQTFAELGQKFAFDSGLIIEPFANLTHTSLFTGTYAEGGGAAALTGGSAYAGLTTVTLGLRSETSVALGDIEAKATAMTGWRQAFGGENSATHAMAGGSDFTVSGTTAGQSAALVGVGLDLSLTDMVHLDLGYDGLFGPGLSSHGIKATLSAKF